MYKIVNMKNYSGGIDETIKYYHGAWGNEKNYSFFADAIKNSTNSKTGLPRFYLLLKQDEIIGCYGIVINDLISRHDLYPWLAGIYIKESERGQELGNLLMKHAESEAKNANYSALYLTTDHDGYYEKYGWKRIEDGYDITGEPTRIYVKQL